MQFLVMRMAINKTEITTGKLITAINILLLLAFADKPESNVSEAENPNDVSNRVTTKINLSCTGSFKKSVNKK